MSLAIRHATEADMVFVLDSWIESYRHSDKAGLISMEDWPTVMPPVLAKILAREGAETLVAYHPGATSTKADIYGWIAFERGYVMPHYRHEGGRHVTEFLPCEWPLIHYFYVKKHYRRMGVWRYLMKAARIDLDERVHLTCITGVVSELPLPRTKYNNNISRFGKREADNGSSKEDGSSKGKRARRRHIPARKS